MIKNILKFMYWGRTIQDNECEIKIGKLLENIENIIDACPKEFKIDTNKIDEMYNEVVFLEVENSLWYGFCVAMLMLSELEETKSHLSNLEKDILTMAKMK